MPIINCPNCRTELEIDATDFGYRMQCPACHSAFTPDPSPTQPPPLPPPPPPIEPGTRVLTCPRCQGQVGIAEEDLGHDMRCPLCDRVFTATADRPSSRPSRRDDDRTPPWRDGGEERTPRYDDEKYDRPHRSRYDDDYDDRPRRRRRSRYDDDCDSPEDLIAFAKRECGTAGVGQIIIGVYGLAASILMIVLYATILSGAFGDDLGPGAPTEAEMWVNLGVCILQLFVSGFLLYAGIQLRQAKQHGVCMIACVLSIIPGFSPCCILGLVFGIMGITKLNDHRVKQGFEANKPGYTSDGYN